MKNYLIALGSNLEINNMTSLVLIKKALNCFSEFNMTIIKESSFWESKSYPDKDQPNFINAVCKVYSELEPKYILSQLKCIEKMLGRKFNKRWGNRVLDLDLLSFGFDILPNKVIFNKWYKMPLKQQLSCQPNELILPHPRIQDRLFVLIPMNEVAPEWIHPILNKSPKELIDRKIWDKENYLKLVEK